MLLARIVSFGHAIGTWVPLAHGCHWHMGAIVRILVRLGPLTASAGQRGLHGRERPVIEGSRLGPGGGDPRWMCERARVPGARPPGAAAETMPASTIEAASPRPR